MNNLLKLLLVIAAAIAFALFAREDAGFILIGRGSWTIETSLSVFLIILVLIGILLYNLRRLSLYLWGFPKNFIQKRALRRRQKAEAALLQGVLSLLLAEWENAETTLLKNRPQSQLEILHYLATAYAACQQNNNTKISDYFFEIREICLKYPELQENPAIDIFQARLYLLQQRPLVALKYAQNAYKISPKHPGILNILHSIYLQLADWSALLNLLPELRKYKALPPERAQELENQLYLALLQESLQDKQQAEITWKKLPKTVRLHPDLVQTYARYLLQKEEASAAESLVREALKHQWCNDLVLLYGELEIPQVAEQITQAEVWTKTHENDPILLLTLGRLYRRKGLFDKAKNCLEQSVNFAPRAITYQVLGDLLTEMGNTTQANEFYRKGLELQI